MIAVQRAGRQALIAERQALHDALTGLPNRVLLPHAHASRRSRSPGARARPRRRDADRPRPLQGDQRHARPPRRRRAAAPGRRAAVGRRCARRDTVARLGGDEFAVLLAGATPAAGVDGRRGASRARLAAAVRRRRASRSSVERQHRHRLLPEHGERRRRRCCSAPTSRCTRPRRAGTGVERLRRRARRQHASQRLALLGELRTRDRARRARSCTTSRRSTCAPARSPASRRCVRWQHPVHGLLPPDEFIPLAEHTGADPPADQLRCCDRALRQMRARGARRALDLGVAVNLSARNLLDARRCPTRVAAMLPALGRAARRASRSRSPRAWCMADPARALPILARLHELGVEHLHRRLRHRLLLAGATCKRLPVDELKIDRSFVATMARDARDAAIVRSHHRPRPQPRPARRRRGRRDARRARRG